jgi:hypothetical protein
METKRQALDQRRTFRDLVIEGLKMRLETEPGVVKERTIKWVCHDGGVPPEANLDDRAAMQDWLRSSP